VNQEWIETAREFLSEPMVTAALIVVGSALTARIVDSVLIRALLRLAERSDTDLDERLIGVLHRPIYIGTVLLGLWGAVMVLDLGVGLTGFLVSTIQTVAILIWTVAGLRVCHGVLDALSRLSERVTWLETRTMPLFDNLARLVLVGGAIYFLLHAWDLNLGAWLASAGVLALAIGFAAKDTLANLFGGLFVIMDAPYKIGDFINLDAGERGRVTKIGLRSTRLLTRDDIEIILPNAQIANSKIVNESGGPWEKLRVTARVGVAYGSDVDHVREVLTRAAGSVENIADEPAPRIRFTEMGDSALLFRVHAWIDEPVLRGQSLDALNTAIYKALNAEKIVIPFPQRDVHLFRE